MDPSNQNIETLGVTHPEEVGALADTCALQQFEPLVDGYRGTEGDAAVMEADQMARAETNGDDQETEAGTVGDVMQSLDLPQQEAVFDFLLEDKVSDPLRDELNKVHFWAEGDSQRTSTAPAKVEDPNHLDELQEGAIANDEEPTQQAVARKRMAADDEQAEPPFDAAIFNEERVEALDRDLGGIRDQEIQPRNAQRVDDGLLDVMPTDMPFGKHSGKATPGLRLLRALRRLQGRHTLQNKAELTFIRLILFETLMFYGRDGSNRSPALLTKWKPGESKRGNATYRWEYQSRNARQTILWVEASFKDVSKYFADKPGKTSFEEVWRQFLVEYGTDLPFPGTFISTMASIKQGTTIEDFVNIYESEYFQRRLRQLEAAHAISGLDVVEWSKRWAQLLARNDEGDKESFDAYELNMIRKLALQLLYSMYDRSVKDKRRTVSIVDIVNRFGIDRITRILRICLPMDRANALYNMAHTKRRKNGNDPTFIRGMIWYAEGRDEEIVRRWRYEGERDPRRNDATINKRLVLYFGVPDLGLDQNRELFDLMQPHRTPLSEITYVQEAVDD